MRVHMRCRGPDGSSPLTGYTPKRNHAKNTQVRCYLESYLANQQLGALTVLEAWRLRPAEFHRREVSTVGTQTPDDQHIRFMRFVADSGWAPQHRLVSGQPRTTTHQQNQHGRAEPIECVL
eukprot:6213345-Pleurochrysis_carterae.AAC.3